jgi:hypothetical protein
MITVPLRRPVLGSSPADERICRPVIATDARITCAGTRSAAHDLRA